MAEEGRHTLVSSLHTVELAVAHFRRVIGLRGGVVLFDRPATSVTRSDLARLYALDGLDATEPGGEGTDGAPPLRIAGLMG
jgi:phosphonate transport system ATP-binding protein